MGQYQLPSQKRILIGTLYSGENEFQQCVEALRGQSYQIWEHRVIENLPNKDAHDTLYRLFMNRSDHFDLFLKLDADMVFKTSESLGQLVELFKVDPELDHVEMVVHDWYSESRIWSVNIFSKRARWNIESDMLFVDLSPWIPGKSRRIDSDPAPLILHSPNPSPYQAFRFGVHRALKVFQPGRHEVNWNRSQFQWEILEGVWNNFVAGDAPRDRRRGLAVLGADFVMQGKVREEEYGLGYGGLIEQYYDCSEYSSDQLYRFLRPRWKWRLLRDVRRQWLIFRLHGRIEILIRCWAIVRYMIQETRNVALKLVTR